MDVTDFRSLLIVLGIVLFLGIFIWAYSSNRRKDFEEAAMLPLQGETLDDDKAEK